MQLLINLLLIVLNVKLVENNENNNIIIKIEWRKYSDTLTNNLLNKLNQMKNNRFKINLIVKYKKENNNEYENVHYIRKITEKYGCNLLKNIFKIYMYKKMKYIRTWSL